MVKKISTDNCLIKMMTNNKPALNLPAKVRNNFYAVNSNDECITMNRII